MRLLTYNILDGGGGRADAIAGVIASQRPDVVALVEADDAAVVDRFARRLGMDFAHAPGNAHASALLSRWPIRASVNHAPLRPAMSKSLLDVIVAAPAGGEWAIGVLHLHARAADADEARREAELDVVLDVFAARRAAGRPHLLCGDFNANAPYQRIDPQRCKPSTREAWRANGGGLPRRVVQRLLDAGYRDTLREADPAAAETVGTFSTEFPGQRVDYVFAYGFDSSRINAAWVVHDDAARSASDHFPVGLEMA